MEIKQVLATATAKQSLLTTVSTIINGVLGAGFYFLLARLLEPSQYGLFSIIVVTITMLADIFDLGGNQALIRFIPQHKSEPQKQNQIINLVLVIKLVSGLVVALAVWVFAHQIAKYVIGQPKLAALLPLAGIGVLAQLLFSFATSLAQATERFWVWSGLFVATNSVRIGLIVALFLIGKLSGATSVMAYISIPLLGFMVSLTLIRFKFSPTSFSDINIRKVFNFNSWVTAFIVVASIGARIDTFLTAKLISLSAMGIYYLANQIVAILPQLTGAIGAVTSPKYSSFDTLAKNRAYTRKATYLTSAVALASSLLIVPLGLLILKFAGGEYLTGLVPMLILLLAMCIFLVTSPIRDSILFFFTKPHFFFWLGIVHVMQTLALSYYLIPKYQIVGSSITLLLGQVLIASASVAYYIYSCKKYGRS